MGNLEFGNKGRGKINVFLSHKMIRGWGVGDTFSDNGRGVGSLIIHRFFVFYAFTSGHDVQS